MRKYIFFITISLFLLNCNGSKKKVMINNQKLLYDSTQTRNGLFKVTLITTLQFDNDLDNKFSDGFYIIHENDTLPLNKKKSITKGKKYHTIEFNTPLRSVVKEFDDINFVDSVKNYKIENKNSNILVVKSSEYSISSLIKLWKNYDKNKIQ